MKRQRKPLSERQPLHEAIRGRMTLSFIDPACLPLVRLGAGAP
jgi:hypothetical protein